MPETGHIFSSARLLFWGFELIQLGLGLALRIIVAMVTPGVSKFSSAIKLLCLCGEGCFPKCYFNPDLQVFLFALCLKEDLFAYYCPSTVFFPKVFYCHLLFKLVSIVEGACIQVGLFSSDFTLFLYRHLILCSQAVDCCSSGPPLAVLVGSVLFLLYPQKQFFPLSIPPSSRSFQEFPKVGIFAASIPD